MHGYFLSLKLYTTARLIANPQSYAEYRDRLLSDKLAAKSESRIRARKDQPAVNKALAERLRRADEKADAVEKRKRSKRGDAAIAANAAVEVGAGADEGDLGDAGERKKAREGLLSNDRFKVLWEDPEFEIDEESREFALLNPATVNNNVSWRFG
jgi:ribosome biogenesis protein ENP2